MSVFKRSDSPNYRFNFIIKGRRFSGTTGRTSKREAEAVEREKRAEAQRLMSANVAADAPMTIDEACGRYWDEVGQHAADRRQVEWTFKWVIPRLGPNKPVRDITNDDIARLVAERRLDPVSYPKQAQKRAVGGKVGPAKRITPSTVNRSVTEPLRRVLKRAHELWGEPIRPIRWRDLKLGEPQERVRYLTTEEEAAIFAVLPDCYRQLVGFAIMGGCRASECLRLTWSDIEWGERRVRIVGKGHKGVPKVRTMPLTSDMRDLLWPMRGGARLDAPIFRNMAGEPATYRSYSQAFRTACARAGVTGLRVHDLRHTAATRILRAPGGNLRVAQRLLGHSSPATTAKYAHVLDDDLRQAMEAAAQESHRSITPQPTKSLQAL